MLMNKMDRGGVLQTGLQGQNWAKVCASLTAKCPPTHQWNKEASSCVPEHLSKGNEGVGCIGKREGRVRGLKRANHDGREKKEKLSLLVFGLLGGQVAYVRSLDASTISLILIPRVKVSFWFTQREKTLRWSLRVCVSTIVRFSSFQRGICVLFPVLSRRHDSRIAVVRS